MAQFPLNNLQTQILHNAHFAAQRVIEESLEDEFHDRQTSEADQRKRVLDVLEENGYDRFLLEKNEYTGLSIAPTQYTESEKDEYGSWHAEVKYSVTEIVAYLIARGLHHTETAVGFIQESFGSDPMYGGPGRGFNSGWNYHLGDEGKSVIGKYSAGLDV